MLQIEVECARVAVVSVLGSHSSAKRAAMPFSKKVLLIDIVTTEQVFAVFAGTDVRGRWLRFLFVSIRESRQIRVCGAHGKPIICNKLTVF